MQSPMIQYKKIIDWSEVTNFAKSLIGNGTMLGINPIWTNVHVGQTLPVASHAWLSKDPI